MFRNNLVRFLFLPLLLIGVGGAALANEGGHGTGNGGDSVAMEFYAIGSAFVKALTVDPATATKFPEVNASAFSRAIEDTIVRGTDEILRDQLGNEKTAINYRENGKAYVKVHRSEYDALPTLLRQRLVFHEYLGVLGLEKSDDYHISNRLEFVLSRPLFGTCEAKRKREVCSIGLRFDPVTRSLDGAYTCHAYGRGEKDTDLMAGELLIGDELKPKNAVWESVRIWPDKGSFTAGFAYADEWVKFSVASSPSPGLRLPFMLTNRRIHLTRPSEDVVLEGSCVLQYR